MVGCALFTLGTMYASSILVTWQGIVEIYSRFRQGIMLGIALVCEYCNEEDTEISKTVSECRREYHRQYHLVSDWYDDDDDDVFSVSGPGSHAWITRRFGIEQICFSNPVPPSDSGQSSPRLWVTNPHSLSLTRRSSMPITRRKWTNT